MKYAIIFRLADLHRFVVDFVDLEERAYFDDDEGIGTVLRFARGLKLEIDFREELAFIA
jgi:hypothetical protein